MVVATTQEPCEEYSPSNTSTSNNWTVQQCDFIIQVWGATKRVNLTYILFHNQTYGLFLKYSILDLTINTLFYRKPLLKSLQLVNFWRVVISAGVPFLANLQREKWDIEPLSKRLPAQTRVWEMSTDPDPRVRFCGSFNLIYVIF